jgi:hypothetical protein
MRLRRLTTYNMNSCLLKVWFEQSIGGEDQSTAEVPRTKFLGKYVTLFVGQHNLSQA